MKLAVVDSKLHVAQDGHLWQVEDNLGSDPIRQLLEEGAELRSLSVASAPSRAIDEGFAFQPPVIQPSKVICVGLNYRDHCREAGVEPPQTPILFTKHPSSLIGSGSPVIVDPTLSAEIDYEVELAVVIGRRCRDVRLEDSLNVVAGYTIANDISARDLQEKEGQWVRAKSFDGFCPMGPFLVTPDEIADPQRLRMTTEVSGVRLQDSTTAEMIFPVAELVAHASQGTTLSPGDVILTGTPWGTGAFRDPPTFLTDGDVLRCAINGLGELVNSVVASTPANLSS